MSVLIPAGRSGSSLAIIRDTARQIDVVKARAAIRSAEIMATGFVVEAGMQTVASFSATEEMLASKVPLATSRLQVIGDMGALRIGAIIREL